MRDAYMDDKNKITDYHPQQNRDDREDDRFFKNNLDNSIEEDLDKGIENQITNTKTLIIQLMSFKHNRKEEPWSIS